MSMINLCENSYFLSFLLIIKYLLCVICIIVPIIIIYKSISLMVKTVINGNNLNEYIPSIAKSFIAGFVVFLIPSFFNFLFLYLLGSNNSFLSVCYNNISLEKINYYKSIENELRDKKNEEERLSKDEAYKKRLEEERKRNEELSKIPDQNNSSNNNSNNPNDVGNYTIHIGDSRTVGMCIAITGDSSNCQLNSGGPKYYGNDIFIAQGSMGYDWFSSNAVSVVNSILSSNPNSRYNIVSYMGVNFLLSDINKYIPLYNNLANSTWNDHNFVVVSVNPVDEVKESTYGYSTKNKDIQSFNSKLKSGINNNIKYCDTYNSLINNFSTSDGLHYTSSTYSNIYQLVQNCI